MPTNDLQTDKSEKTRDREPHVYASRSGDHDETGSRLVGDHVVPGDSPEGRAAMPELKPKGLMILMVSVLLMIIIASIIVAAVWSVPAGMLVLVFGTGLAFLGNPAIWATTMRTQERSEGHAN